MNEYNGLTSSWKKYNLTETTAASSKCNRKLMLSHYRNNNCKKIKKYYKLRLKNVFILEVHIFVPLSLVQLNKKKKLI